MGCWCGGACRRCRPPVVTTRGVSVFASTVLVAAAVAADDDELRVTEVTAQQQQAEAFTGKAERRALAGCPSAPGYTFYPLQRATNFATLKTLSPPRPPAGMAASCNTTRFCNAFDTAGALLMLPTPPTLAALSQAADAAAAQQQQPHPCQGLYVANGRTLSGLVLPDTVNFAAVRDSANKLAQIMNDIITAIGKVVATLRAQGYTINDVRDALQLPPTALYLAFSKAFSSSIPNQLSWLWGGGGGSSTVKLSFNFDDLVAALTYPTWDSRAVPGGGGPSSPSLNFISPVRDQGQCGSCVAFAVIGAAEAAVAAVSKASAVNPNDFSEQWLFFCNGISTPSCDGGWFATYASDALSQRNIPIEANYPYNYNIRASVCKIASSPEVRAGGTFTRIAYNNLQQAKQHIRMYGSVTSYIVVYPDFFSWNPSSPPYIWNGFGRDVGYHQVLVVGYNDIGLYWIVKNSWGTKWGDNGYIRISYYANIGFMSGVGDNIIGLAWQPPPPSPAAAGSRRTLRRL